MVTKNKPEATQRSAKFASLAKATWATAKMRPQAPAEVAAPAERVYSLPGLARGYGGPSPDEVMVPRDTERAELVKLGPQVAADRIVVDAARVYGYESQQS